LPLVLASSFAKSVSDVRDLCCLPELPSKARVVDALVFFSSSTAHGFDTVSRSLDVFRVYGIRLQAVCCFCSSGRNDGCAMDAMDVREDCREGIEIVDNARQILNVRRTDVLVSESMLQSFASFLAFL
jgi:hypothetical protein